MSWLTPKKMIIIGAFILAIAALFTGQLGEVTSFLESMFGDLVTGEILEETPPVLPE